MLEQNQKHLVENVLTLRGLTQNKLCLLIYIEINDSNINRLFFGKDFDLFKQLYCVIWSNIFYSIFNLISSSFLALV